jgi:hypothetical protein
VVLQLQALPFSGGHVKANPGFMQDELAVIVLASFPVDMDAFDGSLAAGPKPIFCSSSPEAALNALKSQEHAHRLCQALAERIKTTEKLTGEQAVQIGPLPRIGKTASPLVRAWIPQAANGEPPNKRQREEEPAATPPPPATAGTVIK